MKRRAFVKRTTQSAALAGVLPYMSFFEPAADVQVQQLTDGPHQHWYGYYDKYEVDPTGRYALGMEVDVFFRSPTKDDPVRIGLIDLHNNNEWTEIGRSTAWSWQQGCMLQWLPGSGEEVIWNARLENDFVSIIHNIKTGEKRILPKAIYALSADGRHAVGTDFARIDNMRVGYGYVGGQDPNYHVKAPDDAGIYKVDLKTGYSELIISYDTISKIPHQGNNIEEKWHYFNHLLVSPDSKRFIFLNRYRDFTLTPEMRADPDANAKYVRGKYTTRMFTAGMDGSNIYELDQSGRTSHFIWRDPQHVLAWTSYNDESGFFLFKDQSRDVKWIGKGDMTQNGHQTYVPNTNNEWLLNDTYPDRGDRKQTLYLYHIPTGKQVILGRFHEPDKFEGEWRCDLHPRCNQDGTAVLFDSTHNGDKRQIYMIDIKNIVR
jgi:hypothetical protein